MRAVELPLHFDPLGLREDLDRLRAGDWTPHFNTRYFAGDWSVVPLRAPADPSRPQADTLGHAWIDTPMLAGCPRLAAAIARFACPLRAVRLLRLAAGSSIREHRDHDLGWELGEVRLHVPITTHAEVEFFVEDRRIGMREGECWYLDLARPHRVHNRSPIDRVHLVLDCRLDDWLRDLIARGRPDEGEAGEFAAFHARVLAEPALWPALIDASEREVFVRRCVELGTQLGFRLLAGDVEAALAAARRSWTSGL
ncbi:aspartyl/asparaginyl beta-hydroxylase domain-containing protein [Nannocystaceae bacterium ST9]